jgi:hypothetical protein
LAFEIICKKLNQKEQVAKEMNNRISEEIVKVESSLEGCFNEILEIKEKIQEEEQERDSIETVVKKGLDSIKEEIDGENNNQKGMILDGFALLRRWLERNGNCAEKDKKALLKIINNMNNLTYV